MTQTEKFFPIWVYLSSPEWAFATVVSYIDARIRSLIFAGWRQEACRMPDGNSAL